MANYDWTNFKETYRAEIAEVAENNDVDMGVGRDMLVKMVCEPDDNLRAKAVETYGPIPEGLDTEAFIADYHAVLDEGKSSGDDCDIEE